MSPVVALMRVFGKKEGQTTADFAKEAREVATDLPFCQEVLDFGIKNGLIEAGTTLSQTPA